MIIIENDGQEILSTNYWQSEHADKGYVYLSINAGAFRLLVPPARQADIKEMLTGREAVISRGPWVDNGGRDALELLFEDDSACPYVLHIVAGQCDRMPAGSDAGKTFVLSIWTEAGKVATMPARFRVVKSLPWLKPWG